MATRSRLRTHTGRRQRMGLHYVRAVTVEFDLLGAEFAARHGPHPTDVRALIHLLDAQRRKTRATPGRLGEQLRLDSAGTTALIDHLEGSAPRSRAVACPGATTPTAPCTPPLRPRRPAPSTGPPMCWNTASPPTSRRCGPGAATATAISSSPGRPRTSTRSPPWRDASPSPSRGGLRARRDRPGGRTCTRRLRGR